MFSRQRSVGEPRERDLSVRRTLFYSCSVRPTVGRNTYHFTLILATTEMMGVYSRQ